MSGALTGAMVLIAVAVAVIIPLVGMLRASRNRYGGSVPTQ